MSELSMDGVEMLMLVLDVGTDPIGPGYSLFRCIQLLLVKQVTLCNVLGLSLSNTTLIKLENKLISNISQLSHKKNSPQSSTIILKNLKSF